MANKKVSQLTSKPSVLVTDLFPIADPSTGQLYKTTISDLGAAIGSGVSSVNGLFGAVVLDTDDIQELVSPTNKWFTDTRARAALSASSPLAYNSGTGVFSIPAATSSQNGYLTSTDWTTFNSKQAALSGTGFVKISGTTISYDNSTYLTTSAAASTYVPYTGATGAVDLGANNLTSKNLIINGAASTFRQLSFYTSSSPRWSIYASNLAETGSNAGSDLVITKTNDDGVTTVPVFTISRATGNTQINFNLSVSTLNTAGIVTNTNAGLLGTSAGTGFLKMSSGTISYDNSTYLTTSSAASTYLPLAGGTLTGGLSGTTATFSGIANFSNNLIQTSTTDQNIYHIINRVNSSPIYDAAILLRTNGANNWGIGLLGNVLGSTTDFAIRNLNTNSTPLRINYSNDAVTFSSSVTATTFTAGSSGTSSDVLINLSADTGAFAIKNVRASHSFSIYDHQSGVDRLWITSAGNVGIGTTSPTDKLYVTSSGFSVATFNSTYGQMLISFANSGTSFGSLGSGISVCSTASADDLGFGTSGLNKSIVFATGSGYLERVRITSGGNLTVANLGTGLVYSSSGALTSTNPSDSRLKTEIKSIEYGLKDILKLRPVSYSWKDDKVNQGIQFGFIAQEVQEIMPDAIKEFGDETKFLGLEKDAIYATLVNAIKELKAELDTLKNK